ncbi:DUF1836 domain-containing protein [Bacillus sp. 1NLA3E]|uniref:DUF1836 domain-containing protein n=1 Tax=Bacillus sp. 1NLA3E TaxID=666686 RepID=UPI000247EA4C|nr:DUF1836 domain-containing protein [Bacillus sp. 1NLA3E]AGK52131.1 hypothetical protein B1NLA3E_01735 [Bacillus sp. 1NLA3E]
MENLNNIVEMLGIEKNIVLEDIPNIDLYMDQVIQFFESTFSSSKRNEDEKILTKTMINNYAKGKLFFPIKNKKYSKEHIILISLIYQLKAGLSINDIKLSLDGINEKVSLEDFGLESFYRSYLTLCNQNAKNFKEDLFIRAEEVKEEVVKLDDKNPEYLEQVLLIASLVNISNMYRRVAEKLVDEIAK